jgi:hypothetical protein
MPRLGHSRMTRAELSEKGLSVLLDSTYPILSVGRPIFENEKSKRLNRSLALRPERIPLLQIDQLVSFEALLPRLSRVARLRHRILLSYQNHRRYVLSLDTEQLIGDYRSPSVPLCYGIIFAKRLLIEVWISLGTISMTVNANLSLSGMESLITPVD